MQAEPLSRFQERAENDLRRWLRELKTSEPRATLSVGIVKQAFSYAEELLRRAAQHYVADAPDGGAEAIAAVCGGKRKAVAKLTLGEYIQLLMYLDARKQLTPTGRAIRKADEALLDRLRSARNNFTHGSPTDGLKVQEMRAFIEDVLQLSESAVVRLAALQRPV